LAVLVQLALTLLPRSLLLSLLLKNLLLKNLPQNLPQIQNQQLQLLQFKKKLRL
jgi:hypothetical protein